MKSVLGDFLMLLLLLLAVTQGASGAQKQDQVYKLPGQPDIPFKQYSGSVEIERGKSLFYYFVQATDDLSSTPVTLWLNGGPGCSSIGLGAFSNIGPFYPNASGTGLVRNPYSWNKETNLLFLDSPVGTGWSRADTVEVCDDNKTARDNFKFLLHWYSKFPEYKDRDLYIAGEGYAGHYVPQLVKNLLDYNDRVDNAMIFNILGVIICNPSLRLTQDVASGYQYLWSHGYISDKTYRGVESSCVWTSVTDACQAFVNEASHEIGGAVNPNDVQMDLCSNTTLKTEQEIDICIERLITRYFNIPEVQQAFHVNPNDTETWNACTQNLTYENADIWGNVTSLIGTMVQRNLQVMIYSRDGNSVIPFLGVRTAVDEIAKQFGLEESSPYRPWFQKKQVRTFNSSAAPGENWFLQAAGWSKTYENLRFATVRGSGARARSREFYLFQKFLTGEPLPRTIS